VPADPATPAPEIDRPVFEVPAGADQEVLEQTLARAVARIGSRPVLHLPFGTYAIRRPIVVPAGDLQIVGDGPATVLHWTGPDIGPVLHMNGPTQATIRNLTVDGNGSADGIVVTGADQPGARVYLQAMQSSGGRLANLFVDALDHAVVRLDDFGHSGSSSFRASVVVRGGPRLSAGLPAEGHTSIYSGASSHNVVSYDVGDGGVLLVRDMWYEQPDGPRAAYVHGRGAVTIDGARVATPSNQSTAALEADDLNGTFTVVGADLDDRLVLSGDGTHASALALGLMCQLPLPACVRNTASPPGTLVVLASRQRSTLPFNRSVAGPNAGTPSPDLIRSLLRQAREDLPGPIIALPAGVTDLRLYGVTVQSGRYNVRVSP
jgi:hypothetical protein